MGALENGAVPAYLHVATSEATSNLGKDSKARKFVNQQEIHSFLPLTSKVRTNGGREKQVEIRLAELAYSKGESRQGVIIRRIFLCAFWAIGSKKKMAN
jgi:hypothetical protein